MPERKRRRERMAGINAAQSAQLNELIAAGQEHAFYLWGAWRSLRERVLRMDRWECQICRARGRYSRGEIVHHVKHLRDRPDLALSVWDPETGERQLVTVCKACHEAEHPEALRRLPCATPLTAERWD